MPRLIAIILLSNALALAGAAARAEMPVETYTLDDALLKAERNNAELQNAEKEITISEQQVQEARLRFLPEIGLQGNATRFKSRYPFVLRPEFRSIYLRPSTQNNIYSGQAYMTMSLYEGRRNINTLRLAKRALKQARSKYEAVKLDVVLRTKEVFYKLILAQEELKAAEEISKTVESMPRRSETGAWEKLDLELLESELRSARSAARHELDLARLAFLKGLNRELDTPVQVRGELETYPVKMDLRKAIVWATELRPEMQSQIYKSQMDDIAVSLALSRRIPTVKLGLDYEVTNQEFPLNQNNWDATVGVRIPFTFDFWTQHNKKLAEKRQGEVALAELHDRVHLEVRRAHKDLLYWQDEWKRRSEELEHLSGLFRSASRSRAGLTAMRAAVRMLSARRRFLESVAEHILSKARLERAIGRELPSPS